MTVRRFLLVAATLGALAACGLITGVGDLSTAPERERERENEDGAAPLVDGSPADLDARVDAPATVDAGDASTPCVGLPATPNDSGTLTAPRAAGSITIDGLLDDWACTPFTRLDRASAAEVVAAPDAGTPAAFAMDFAVVWEPSALYVAARVSSAGMVEGNATVGVFKNDSLEVYLDADGVLTGQGGINDRRHLLRAPGRCRRRARRDEPRDRREARLRHRRQRRGRHDAADPARVVPRPELHVHHELLLRESG